MNGVISYIGDHGFAILSFISAFALFLRNYFVTEPKVNNTKTQTNEISKNVNGRLTVALLRIEQLSKALSDAGIPIPDSTVFQGVMGDMTVEDLIKTLADIAPPVVKDGKLTASVPIPTELTKDDPKKHWSA